MGDPLGRLVAGSIVTSSLPDVPWVVTQTAESLAAIPKRGFPPTPMFAVTLFVVGLIRATDPEWVTQMAPAPAASLLKSPIPETGIVAAIWFVDGSIRTTEPLSV